MLISTATSTDEAARAADVAVLPNGSFEQHGDHLPLATDTLIASIIARRVATDYNLFLLPAITFSCSHEHAGFPGSVSISSTALHAIVTDIAASLAQAGTHKLAIINGHGGNYVLSKYRPRGQRRRPPHDPLPALQRLERRPHRRRLRDQQPR